MVTIDVGTKGPPEVPADVDRSTVAGFHPADGGHARALSHSDRGQAITAMGEAFASYLRREYDQGKVAGVIGIGGSGGTALITPAMRGLPVGVPKLMVSTVASGNTAPFVGCSDVALTAFRRRRRRNQRRFAACARQRRRRHGGDGAVPSRDR